MRISDWSSDVCSSDLLPCVARILKRELAEHAFAGLHAHVLRMQADRAQEAHVAQQRIAELADVDLGGADAYDLYGCDHAAHLALQLGRASVRESVCHYV